MVTALLAIDAGTTTIKAVGFGMDGRSLASSSQPTPVTLREGQAVQDMDETWSRTRELIAEVVEQLSPEATVEAVGVTGQGGGCWLVDEDGQPVGDAIVWTDGRAADLVEAWRESGFADRLFERFGYGVFPGQALPILSWLADHEPERLADADVLLGCKDWLRYCLTGDLASDPAEMSLCHYSPIEGAFDHELPVDPGLAELEPPIEEPTAVTGHVSADAGAATGLPAGTPVVTGTFDVAVSAFGSGAVEPGSTSAIVGTTLQIQQLLPSPRIEPPPVGYTLGFESLGDGMGLRAMGAMTGTPNLDWIRETLASEEGFAAIEEQARAAPVGSGGLLYLPYLSTAGEKAPFVDPNARAGFIGLEPSHSREALFRAVYEGVALSLRHCAENLPGATDRVFLSGGGAESSFWCQLFADCLGSRVTVPDGAEFGARGAAMLAGIGIGRFRSLEQAAKEMVGVESVYEPRPAARSQYDAVYSLYADLPMALENAWRRRRVLLSDTLI